MGDRHTMFQYLEGRITDVQPAYIVVDVHGVGYLVRAANPYQYEVGDKLVRVYVHQAISDTAQVLYGFGSLDEKRLFEKLLAVSGIGAKSALAILANGDQAAIIRAIQDNDVKFLTHFPGVGKKTAQQIVLDLKDKLDDLGEVGLFTTETVADAPTSTNPQLADAIAALTALGYRDRDVAKIEKTLNQEPGKTTDDYLSAGLKLLTNA